MLRIVALVVLLAIGGNSYSQFSSREFHGLALIPDSAGCTITSTADGRTIILGAVPFPRRTPNMPPGVRQWTSSDSLRYLAGRYDAVVCNNAGWIYSLENVGSTVGVAQISDSGNVIQQPDIALPKGFRGLSCGLTPDRLYIGGEGTSQVLGYFSLADSLRVWQSIHVPNHIIKNKRRIDALAISGGDLIAIDNLLLPIWALGYQPDFGGEHRLVMARRLQVHGTYESVKKAVANTRSVAVLSSSSGQMGYSQHISICLPAGMLEVVAVENFIQSSRWAGYPERLVDSNLSWESIALYRNRLLVASGNRGIGLLDLSTISYSLDSTVKSTVSLKYLRPKSIGTGSVLNILPREELNSVAVIMNVNDRLETCLMSEDELIGKSGTR